jgi:hypothetical protein
MAENVKGSGGDDPRWKEIKERVIAKIKAVIDSDLMVTEGSFLEHDLEMDPMIKELMAVAYSEIAESYPGGISVHADAAGQCQTVNDAINLVYEKSYGR